MAARALILCLLLAPHVHGQEFQVVLDDMDTATSPASLQINTHEGSFEPCMRDAHDGQFHHDGASNKGSAEFGYTFDPPASGCYSLEEYHPGAEAACAQYMPRNAVLDVDYCKGLFTSLSVNQAVNPAQWNAIGSFMFYEGYQGKLTMRNSNDESCAAGAGGCFFVADAFRLTRIGDSCDTESRSSESAPRMEEGTVSMSAQATDGHLDVMSWMKRQRSVLEATLTLHLGYNSVSVLSITGARRLSPTVPTAGDPDSWDAQQTHNFEIRFRGFGTSSAQTGNLQEGLDTALDRLHVMSASVALTPLSTGRKQNESDSASSGCTLFYLGVGACALLGLAGSAFCVYRKCKKNKMQAGTAAVETKEIESEAVDVELAQSIDDGAKVKSTLSDDKDEKLSDNASGASTDEPTSDANSNVSKTLSAESPVKDAAEEGTVAPQETIEV